MLRAALEVAASKWIRDTRTLYASRIKAQSIKLRRWHPALKMINKKKSLATTAYLASEIVARMLKGYASVMSDREWHHTQEALAHLQTVGRIAGESEEEMGGVTCPRLK